MSNWLNVKVGELGRIVTGKTPKTSVSENYGGDIPFLTPSDDMSRKYSGATKRTLSTLGVQGVKNCLLPENAVCVSCIGSDLGKVTITAQPTVTNQQINSIIVDTTRFDVDFVYYAMRILGKTLNYVSKTSTAVPIVNKSSFSEYEISVPSLDIQQKISSVLSVIDDKIALNMRINDNLADLLHTHYQSCFEHTAINSKLGALSDICEFSRERIAISEISAEEYFSTENMLPNKAGVTEATMLPIVAQTTRCRKGDTLISNIRPYFKKIYYCHSDCACSSDVLCFVPRQAISGQWKVFNEKRVALSAVIWYL